MVNKSSVCLHRVSPRPVRRTHRSSSLVCAGLALVSSGLAPRMCGSRSRACAGLDPLCVRVSLSRTCWSHPRVGAGLAPVYAPVSLPWMCQTHSPVGAGTALVYARVSLPCRPRPRSRVCAGPAPSYVPVPLPGMCGFRPQVCAGPALVRVRVSLPCICLYRSLGCVDLDPLYVTVPTRVCAGSAPCVCPANSRACPGHASSHVPVSLPCMPTFAAPSLSQRMLNREKGTEPVATLTLAEEAEFDWDKGVSVSGIVIDGHIVRGAACQLGQRTAGSPWEHSSLVGLAPSLAGQIYSRRPVGRRTDLHHGHYRTWFARGL